MMNRSFSALVLALTFVSLIAVSNVGFAQRTKPYQHLWEVDHGLGDIWLDDKDPPPPPINVERLLASELADQIEVAQEICRKQFSVAAISRERAVTLLRERLEQPQLPLQARRAFASALLLLSDSSQAEFLWQLAESDTLLRSKVEAKLAELKSSLPLESWRARLQDAAAKPKAIALAIEGIAAVGGTQDNVFLEGVLRGNATTNGNRILAADVLGRLNKSELNALAQEILDSDVEQSELLAAHLLKQHSNEASLPQLRVAYDRGSSVAQLIAARALFANYRDVAREYAPKFVAHADSSLRMLAAQQLQSWDDDESLRLQTRLLSDPSKEIRRFVGEHFLKRAKSGQRAVVDEAITEQLSGTEWQGLEQAVIVAVSLEDRSRCGRFVELIEHKRPEVYMCAAWGLMELAEETEHFVAMQKHVRKMADQLAVSGAALPAMLTDIIRISYLNEAFGRVRYEPAIDLLMEFVPKNDHKYGHVSRASAIWALGKIYDGKDNAKLRATLCERLLDNPIINPEDPLVRTNSALALGEMAFEDSAYAIEKFNDGSSLAVSRACRWAIGEIKKQSAPK